MIKIVFPICCGLDVHNFFILASTDEKSVTSCKHHHFSTFTKGLRGLADWLKVNSCNDVCKKSTEKYRIPVYNVIKTTCN